MKELSTLEILNQITQDYDQHNRPDAALEVYLFAKKVNNAASVAMKMTQEHATEMLISSGGKYSNHFAAATIQRQFEKRFAENDSRKALIDEIEVGQKYLDALKERLSEVEKQMEKSGQVEKMEIGQTIKVSLNEKI